MGARGSRPLAPVGQQPADKRPRAHAGWSEVTTKIAHSPDANGSYAELTVTDDGPGTDAELLPHLFERFVRADEARSRQLGSTGLGLAIVLSIVEAHHGSVSVESETGQTSFRIRIPTIGAPTAWWPGPGSNRRPSAFQADAHTN